MKKHVILVILILIGLLCVVSPVSAAWPPQGTQGPPGINGTNATVDVNATFTGLPDTSALVTNIGNHTATLLDFTIPRGATGLGSMNLTINLTANMTAGSQGIPGLDNMTANMTAGPAGTAATIVVNNTFTGLPDTPAIVTNIGTTSAALFDFTVPQGLQGATGATGEMNQTINQTPGLMNQTINQTPGLAATIAVNNTFTGDPGTSAIVNNIGSSSAANLDFTIPQGIQGIQGIQGEMNQTINQTPNWTANMTAGPAGAPGPDNDAWYLWINGTRAMTGNLSMGGFNISELMDPVVLQDAVTLNYLLNTFPIINNTYLTSASLTPYDTIANQSSVNQTIQGQIAGLATTASLNDYYRNDTTKALFGSSIRRNTASDYLDISGGNASGNQSGRITLYGGDNVAQSGGIIMSVGNASGGSSEVVFSVLGRTDQASLDLNANKIITLADPTVATDAANKRYVDIQKANDTAVVLLGNKSYPLTDGSRQFTGDVTIPTINLSGGQIKFPSTQSASANTNTLDDYKEGSWTMGLAFGGGTTGITYSYNTGYYTKFGNIVIVNGFLQLSSKGSSTGAAQLTGLPYPIFNNAAAYSAPNMFYSKVTYVGYPTGFADIGGSSVSLYEVTEAGVYATLQDTDFANDAFIIITMTYKAA